MKIFFFGGGGLGLYDDTISPSMYYPAACVSFLKDGPTYRDLLPSPPPPGLVPSCAEGGVLGILPGVVGCIQVIMPFSLKIRTIKRC